MKSRKEQDQGRGAGRNSGRGPGGKSTERRGKDGYSESSGKGSHSRGGKDGREDDNKKSSGKGGYYSDRKDSAGKGSRDGYSGRSERPERRDSGKDSERGYSRNKRDNSDKSGYSSGREKTEGSGYKSRSNKPYDREKKEGFSRDSERNRGGDRDDRRGRSEDKAGRFGRDDKPFDREKKSFSDRGDDKKSGSGNWKSHKPFKKRDDERFERKPGRERKEAFDRKSDDKGRGGSRYSDRGKSSGAPYRKRKPSAPKADKVDDGSMRLNRYLAHAGVSSRREADVLIEAGAVSVNGKVVTELGFKVMPGDKVQYGGQSLSPEQPVYLLLNKPKDYITTTDDPRKRKTVLELIAGACKERVYPVGRLDRNTSGVLLFTNDGELSKRLLHPKYGIRKIYHVTVDKNVSKNHLEEMLQGLELEDGFVKVDEVEYVGDGKDKKEIGIEIHSGKNRIIRRLMEHFGYSVVKLDRVVFAGLTKKDLPRGAWRHLTEKEVNLLKMQAGAS